MKERLLPASEACANSQLMIIVYGNAKGGVGKSTVAVHMTDWLSLHDCSTILVDCDAQRLSSRWLKVARPEQETLTLDDPKAILRELPKLSEKYDAVVVDAPGGLNDVTVALFSIADAAIVPTSGSQLDVMGLSWTIKTIHQIQAQREGMPMTVVLPVKAEARLKTTRNLKLKAKRLGFGVTQTTLALRQIYSQVAGLEAEDGESWEIPPSILWDLGRSQTVRVAALEIDAAFQEIFPEACQENPDRIRSIVTQKSKLSKSEEGSHGTKIAANV